MIEIQTLVTGLSINIALLLSLTLLCNLIRSYLPQSSPLNEHLIYGVIFGGIAVLGMLMHISILPGIVIDGRVIIAGLAGAFAGPVAGIAAGVIISAYRLVMGGIGTLAGVGAILTASCFGILVYFRWGTVSRAYRLHTLIGFGVALALQGLLWSVALPADIAWPAFKVYALPVGLFYPLGTVIIGTLLANEHRHRITLQALQTSEERLREAFELSRDALYKRNLNSHHYAWVSPAVEQITGLPVSQWLSVGEKRLTNIIHPDDLDKTMTHLDQLVDLTPSDAQEFSIEYRILKPDGTYRWILDRHIILFDAKGHAEFVVGNAQDITQRKASQHMLENHKHIISSTKDLMALVSKDLAYQAVSNSYAAVMKTTPDQLIGKPIDKVLGPTILRISRPLIQRCLAGEDVHSQSWVTYPNGKRRFTDTNYFPHYEKGTGKISGYVVSVRDMTEYKRMEDKLLQSYKMEAIGTLAGGIAHDFNNILGAVLGYTDLALTMTKNEAVHEMILNVRGAGERATELVRQILTFSRQTEQEVTPLMVKPIVKEALKLLQASIPASISIEKEIKSDGYIMGDPTQVHQIVMNLCTNAAHAMKGDGGCLKVSLTNVDIDADHVADHPGFGGPGRYLCLRVSDTGSGIPRKILDRIFDPFFTTKPEGEGTGMGLSMIHGIIKSYKGDISVYSQVDKGTQVRVFIPIIEPMATMEVSGADKPLPTGTERVLFVDDDAALADIGQRMLTKLGYQVTVRESSAEALRIFSQSPYQFDLVITDLTMPNMSGDKLAAEFIALRADIPIIIVTGFSEQMKEAQMKRMGIKKVILKPLIKRHLAESIREVLDQPD